MVFSDEWDGLPFSCKHLLRHFLPDIPLVWVETIGLRSPGFNSYDVRRAYQKLKSWFLKPQKSEKRAVPENLSILNPIQLPYNRYGFIRRLNASRLIAAVSHFNRTRGVRGRVFFTTWPFLGELIGRMGEDLSIYYRVDDFSEFPGVDSEWIREAERDTMERVDVVLGTAENLARVQGHPNKGKYLPHGVDFEHFASPMKPVPNVERILEIPRPRIGFFGLLSSWVDLEMLARVADLHPEWAFVIIGPSQLPKSAHPVAANIYYLGPVPYCDLPGFARHFDVGLIPFKVNALTISVNPLKLMEYFSLGIPVVSTPLPEVMKYKDYVEIAIQADDFSIAIERCIANDSQNGREIRRRIAEANSWKSRSLEVKDLIENALKEKIVACR